MLNMKREEVLCCKFGEMMDLIACLSIYNGTADPKEKKRKLSYDEAIALR